MDKTLKIVIIAGILLVSFSVVFYFVYFLPTKQAKLEEARKDCSLISVVSMTEALSKEGNEQEKKAWQDNNCGDGQSGFKPYVCSQIRKEIVNKELDNKTGKKIDAPEEEFERCMRRKGLVN